MNGAPKVWNAIGYELREKTEMEEEKYSLIKPSLEFVVLCFHLDYSVNKPDACQRNMFLPRDSKPHIVCCLS